MKRKIVGVMALATVLTLTACSNNSNSDSAKTSKSSSSSDNTKTISQNKEVRADFDKIKVGELMNNGKGGSTESEVKKILGYPSTTTSSKTDGVKTTGFVWNKGDVQVTVSFTNKNAISKSISGFKWSGRPEKLDLKSFNAVKEGSSYKDIVNKFGEPDGLDESMIMGTRTIIISYLTGVKGNSGANASFTFANNKLTDKAQTNLK